MVENQQRTGTGRQAHTEEAANAGARERAGMSKTGRQPRRQRADYAKGLPDYHDPTAGFGGAAPAQSALTLRAWLAGFGVVVCIVGAGLAVYLGVAWFAWVMGVIAVVAAVDLAWVLRRKARGEPG